MITYEQTIAALHAAVAERGEDFVYPTEWKDADSLGCRYFLADGKPACIAGLVLAKFGFGPDVVTENVSVDALDFVFGEFDEASVLALAAAQQVQDTDGTWGKALATAESYTAEPDYEPEDELI